MSFLFKKKPEKESSGAPSKAASSAVNLAHHGTASSKSSSSHSSSSSSTPAPPLPSPPLPSPPQGSTSVTQTHSSTSSSSPPLPAPPSSASSAVDSDVNSTAGIPLPEEKMSEEALALRKHFSSIPLSRRVFSVGETLGTGTFGRVRLVSYIPPGASKKQHFALKMLKKSEIIRLKQVEHIKAEKSILTRICHPFIVNLFAHWQDDSHLHMLMEYVIGGELFSQLRKVGRFSNDTARFYASQIVLALQYLHSKNIVYRDLKPENLLIDHEGFVKVTDFGFAKVVEDRTWTLCGT
jgi:hypothetical protein